MFFCSVLERRSREILYWFSGLALCVCGIELEPRICLLKGAVVVHSFSFSLFPLSLLFSLLLLDSFLTFLVRIRFRSTSSDIGLVRLPIKPLTGTEKVLRGLLLISLPSPIFSPTEQTLVWLVLLLWCLPARMSRGVIYAPSMPFL